MYIRIKLFLNKVIISILIIIIILVLVYLYFMFFYKLDNKDNWYTTNKLIGHALYGIDEFDYTNSKEALVFAYNKGIRVVEADFLFTNDNILVLNHYWKNNQVLSYDEFINTKINEKYTSMDLKMLLNIMNIYQDLYVVIDTKENEYSNKYLSVYKTIVEETSKINSNLLDRFIIQIYEIKEHKEIKKIYNFQNYIFTTYKLTDINMRKIVYYCLSNNIHVVAIPKEHLLTNLITKDEINLIKHKNIKIYSYTVNYVEELETLLNLGVDGVYTDYLSESLNK